MTGNYQLDVDTGRQDLRLPMNGDNLTEASNTEMVKNAKEAPGGLGQWATLNWFVIKGKISLSNR